MLQDKLYDLLIIGTGPAALSAAMTARVRELSVATIGAGDNQFVRAHMIENYPGLPHISGVELWRKFSYQAADLGAEHIEDWVSEVVAMDNHFDVLGKNAVYRAKALILATGAGRVRPYQGESELVGAGVHYCATCDARAYRGRDVAVVADDASAWADVELLAKLAAHVYFLPQTDALPENLPENVAMYQAKPLSLAQADSMIKLTTSRETLEVAGVFILRAAAPVWQLLPDLRLENGSVAVDRQLRTNIEGVFAAGDITGAPFQFAKAVGEGNVAALSAAAWVAGNRGFQA